MKGNIGLQKKKGIKFRPKFSIEVGYKKYINWYKIF